MKITLVISSLRGGGAERVMTTLANVWARQGHSVHLITLAGAEEDNYSLDAEVNRIELHMMKASTNPLHALLNNARRIGAIRKALRGIRPDWTISFMLPTNVITTIAARSLGFPVAISERASILDQPPVGIWRLFFRPVYRQATVVVAQTPENGRQLESILARPVDVIRNPLSEERNKEPDANALSLLQTLEEKKIVLGVGRLGREKGFDLVIEAFSRIYSAATDWALVILGEGPERDALMQQVSLAGLEKAVLMPGFVSFPRQVMRHAEIFVLPSRYEGMPNALIEAMSEGLACVSFDCRTGPRDLIEHGTNGILVEPQDVDKLTEALLALIGDAPRRAMLGAAASSLAGRFDPGSVAADWLRLLQARADDRLGAL